MRAALVYDTETTGLTLHPDAPIVKSPRIIEFGAVLLDCDTYEELEHSSILINPGIPITEEITKITGLTDADVKDAPTFIQALPQIGALFAKAQSMWAHNLPFDRAIIQGELARLAAAAVGAYSLSTFPWPARAICTVGLYKDAWGYNPKLIELYEAVTSKKYEQTHRALDDVRALVEIIKTESLLGIL